MDSTFEQVREKTEEEKLLDKIERIARVCYEANRAYIRATTGEIVPDWDSALPWHQHSTKMGVQRVLEAPDMTPKQIHDHWMDFRLEQGWTYGKEKDEVKKTHPSLVPYDLLPESEKTKDRLFRAIIDILKDE